MRILSLILFLILIAIAFIFGSQNEQLITLNYLAGKIELSIAAAASVFTAIGFFFGLLVTLLWRMIRKSKKSRASKNLTEA